MITIADVVDLNGDSVRVYSHSPLNKGAVTVDAYMWGELEATLTFTAERALELAQALIKAAEGVK